MIIFIAGARSISRLAEPILNRINSIIDKKSKIILGDANGADKAVQKYLHSLNYSEVTIYATNGIARNNLGCWNIENVDPKRKTKDFKYYMAKDLVMAKKADYGLMIWNGISKGTLYNIIRLLILKKGCFVFYNPIKKMHYFTSISELDVFINNLGSEIIDLYNQYKLEIINEPKKQISFFD